MMHSKETLTWLLSTWAYNVFRAAFIPQSTHCHSPATLDIKVTKVTKVAKDITANKVFKVVKVTKFVRVIKRITFVILLRTKRSLLSFFSPIITRPPPPGHHCSDFGNPGQNK